VRVLRARVANDRSVLWLACVLALCAGYYLAFYRLGAAIDLQHDLTAEVTSTMRANSAIAAAGPQLAQTEHDLNAALNELDIHADHATTVARFIRESARIATLNRTGLVQIDERRGGAVDLGNRQGPAGDAPFETIPLDVTLSGSYRDLVGTIRGLAQAPVAMRIEIAAIERDAGAGEAGGPPAVLTARLHVSVVRLSGELPPPSSPTVPLSEEALHARQF
jgi:hypothetical protein